MCGIAAGNPSASSIFEKLSVCTEYIIELFMAEDGVLLKCGALHACSFCNMSRLWHSFSLWSLLCTYVSLMMFS